MFQPDPQFKIQPQKVLGWSAIAAAAEFQEPTNILHRLRLQIESTLGFDWLLLFLRPGLHHITFTMSLRLTCILISPANGFIRYWPPYQYDMSLSSPQLLVSDVSIFSYMVFNTTVNSCTTRVKVCGFLIMDSIMFCIIWSIVQDHWTFLFKLYNTLASVSVLPIQMFIITVASPWRQTTWLLYH